MKRKGREKQKAREVSDKLNELFFSNVVCESSSFFAFADLDSSVYLISVIQWSGINNSLLAKKKLKQLHFL